MSCGGDSDFGREIFEYSEACYLAESKNNPHEQFVVQCIAFKKQLCTLLLIIFL